MRKFLLVVMIGMVLAMDLYGIVNGFIQSIEQIEEVDKSYETVYVE